MNVDFLRSEIITVHEETPMRVELTEGEICQLLNALDTEMGKVENFIARAKTEYNRAIWLTHKVEGLRLMKKLNDLSASKRLISW